MRARWYDTATAQFLSVDPLVAQTGATYTYASDSPANRTDITGLTSLLEYVDPLYWYGQEVQSYQSGCGYLESVRLGLVGTAVAGAEVAVGALAGPAVAELRAGRAAVEGASRWGSEMFLSFAKHFPRTAAFWVKRQAYQQVTLPGKATIAKAAFDTLKRLLSGG